MPKKLPRRKVPVKTDLPSQKISKYQTFLKTLIVFLIIAGASGSYYFYNQYQKTQRLLSNQNQVTKAEMNEWIKKVEKLIELPKDEIPTIATVSDLSKLKNQPFFANAKKGDKIFIYSKAKRAYLYRPSENKIIEVAAINLNEAK